MRNYLDAHRFVDIETPMLTKATPEGARDYLVPSRTHPGKFFALPQSPQIFKQLLMISGFDRYYQIVRCFRDEDLRADRQPDFTQVDIETSFLTQDEIMLLMEGLVRAVFQSVLSVELPNPFPRMTYAEAMRRYGSDKPDLRIPLELVDVADLVRDSDFKVFAGPAKAADGRVAALQGAEGRGAVPQPDRRLHRARRALRRQGPGLRQGQRRAPPAARACSRRSSSSCRDAAVAGILERTGAAERRPDLLRRRPRQGRQRQHWARCASRSVPTSKLVANGWRPLWVVDFPMFERDAAGRRWAAMHHPFTSPANEDPVALAADPGAAIAKAYDCVLNGSEIGGGSVRIHREELQSTVFGLLGIDPEEARVKFGFLLDALKFGAPPHGGIAFGLDRLAMLMARAPTASAR